MDNLKFNVDDYINCIKENNIEAHKLNILAIKQHINNLINDLFLLYTFDKFSKIGYSITRKQIKELIVRTDMFLISQEIKILSWLCSNIDYLYEFDNMDKAISLVNIYYYLNLIDFDRVEYLEVNSNKGRTIVADYMLNNIGDYLDEININLIVFDGKEKSLKRELTNEE